MRCKQGFSLAICAVLAACGGSVPSDPNGADDDLHRHKLLPADMGPAGQPSTPDLAGCMPTTCSGQCGTISDGCGGTLDCGSCSISSGIIPANRQVDWTQVGIPGGIPKRTTICQTVDATTYGNGSTDATSAIQAALDACAGKDAVVYLPAGKYYVGGSITVPSHTVLRGAGPGKTILDAHGSGDGVVYLGADNWLNKDDAVGVSGGTTAGSKQVTLATVPSTVAVGNYLLITQANDPSFVSISGDEGPCTWCDIWGGSRSMGQIVEITSVSGSTVQVTPPLNYNFSRTPLALPFSAGGKYVGVELLRVSGNNTGYNTNYMMSTAAYSWLKGVESDFPDGDMARVFFGFRDEIRDSYFHDGYSHNPGGTDDDIFIAVNTSNTLVENNIVTRGHASIMLNWGAAGNVIAYNYTDYGFFQDSNSIAVDFAVHGAHPSFNLYEGNIGNNFAPDSIWGTSSHNTALRNWWKGADFIMNPQTGRGLPDPMTGHYAFQAIRVASLTWGDTSYSLVGNVIGSDTLLQINTQGTLGNVPCSFYDGCMYAVQTPNYMKVYPDSDPLAYDGQFYEIAVGYSSNSSGGAPAANLSVTAASSLILEGNWDYVTKSVHWSGSAQTIPASLYKSSAPAFWHTPWGTPAWPAIGPDVTGGDADTAGHVYKTPARLCYEHQNLLSGAAFDPIACYGG
jgi:hypothetical protein